MKTLFRIVSRVARAGLFSIGLLLSGLGVGAIAGLPLFTPPGNLSTSVNFPSSMADLNTLIQYLYTYGGFGNANGNVGLLGPSGRLNTQVGPTTDLAANIGGVTIATYTIPANAFDIPGRTLKIHVNFHTSANFNSRSAECGVGANVVTITIATTSKAGQGTCDFIVTAGTTANTQMFAGTIIFATTSATTAQVAELQGTVSNSITSATGTPAAYFAVADPTASADIVMDNFEVTYES